MKLEIGTVLQAMATKVLQWCPFLGTTTVGMPVEDQMMVDVYGTPELPSLVLGEAAAATATTSATPAGEGRMVSATGGFTSFRSGRFCLGDYRPGPL